MLQKYQKPGKGKDLIKKGIIGLAVVEGLFFVGSYYIWHNTNTNREFRKYLHVNYPVLLEGYYKIGETISGDDSPRYIDQAYWEAEKKESSE